MNAKRPSKHRRRRAHLHRANGKTTYSRKRQRADSLLPLINIEIASLVYDVLYLISRPPPLAILFAARGARATQYPPPPSSLSRFLFVSDHSSPFFPRARCTSTHCDDCSPPSTFCARERKKAEDTITAAAPAGEKERQLSRVAYAREPRGSIYLLDCWFALSLRLGKVIDN